MNKTTFRPGGSGNPNGRPRTRDMSLGELLRRKVATPRTKSELANKLVKLATKGESEAVCLKALAMIFDQIDGRPAQRTAEKAKDGKIEVVFEDANQTP